MKEMKVTMVFFSIWAIILLCDGTDVTDKSFWVRSNMHHYKDYGTGCEYLAGGGFFGKENLIPRVDSKGKHICGVSQDINKTIRAKNECKEKK